MKFLVIRFVALISIVLMSILLVDGGVVEVIQDGKDEQHPKRTYEESIMPSRQWQAHVPDGEITGIAMVPKISSCDTMEIPSSLNRKWIAIINGSKIKENNCSLEKILSTAKKSYFRAAILYNKKDLDVKIDVFVKNDDVVPFEIIRTTDAENLMTHYSCNSGKDYLVRIRFFDPDNISDPVDNISDISQDDHSNPPVDDDSNILIGIGCGAITLIMIIVLSVVFRDRLIAMLPCCRVSSPTNVNQDENNQGSSITNSRE